MVSNDLKAFCGADRVYKVEPNNIEYNKLICVYEHSEKQIF